MMGSWWSGARPMLADEVTAIQRDQGMARNR